MNFEKILKYLTFNSNLHEQLSADKPNYFYEHYSKLSLVHQELLKNKEPIRNYKDNINNYLVNTNNPTKFVVQSDNLNNSTDILNIIKIEEVSHSQNTVEILATMSNKISCDFIKIFYNFINLNCHSIEYYGLTSLYLSHVFISIIFGFLFIYHTICFCHFIMNYVLFFYHPLIRKYRLEYKLEETLEILYDNVGSFFIFMILMRLLKFFSPLLY